MQKQKQQLKNEELTAGYRQRIGRFINEMVTKSAAEGLRSPEPGTDRQVHHAPRTDDESRVMEYGGSSVDQYLGQVQMEPLGGAMQSS